MYSQEEDNECYWNVFIVTQLEFRDSIGMTNWLIAKETLVLLFPDLVIRCDFRIHLKTVSCPSL